MPNIPELKIGNTTYKVKDGDLRRDIIKSGSTQPTEECNKIWVNEAASTEYQVPTYSEFSDLKSALKTETETREKITAEYYEDNNVFSGAEIYSDAFFDGTYHTGTAYIDYKATSYLKAEANKTYKVTVNDPINQFLIGNVFCVDSNRISLGACTYDGTAYTITTKANTAYIVCNFLATKTNFDDVMLIPSGESPVKGIIPSAIQKRSITGEKLTAELEENIEAANSIINGKQEVTPEITGNGNYINRSGNYDSTPSIPSFYRSDRIEIPTTTYKIVLENVAPYRAAVLNYNAYFYAEDGSKISGTDNVIITSIPDTAKYIAVSGVNETQNGTVKVVFYCGIEEHEDTNYEYRFADLLVNKACILGTGLYADGGAYNGDLVTDANYFTSFYFQVKPNTDYSVNAGDPYIASDGGHVCFYDLGKRSVGRQRDLWKHFKTPSGAAFARVCVGYGSPSFGNTSFEGITITEGDCPKPINKYPYLKNNLTGKKWTVIGDSITHYNFRSAINYHQYVAADLGLDVINAGVSGAGYKQHDEIGGSLDAFYLYVVRENDNNEYIVDLDSDVITIFGGVNDVLFGGTIGTADDNTTDTICGCVNQTIANIRTRCGAYAPLGIISPLPCVYQGTSPQSGTQLPTDPTCRMQTFVTELEKICVREGIPFLDLFHHSNFNPSNASFRSMYTSCAGTENGDGLHPNQYGHELFYRQVKAFVESIIK